MDNVLEGLAKLTKTEDITAPQVVEQVSNDPILQHFTPDVPPVQQVVNPVIVQPEPVAPIQEDVIDSEEALLNYIASRLEIADFTPTQQGADAILELANYKVNQIQNQYKGFDNQDIVELKEHIEQGGDINSFRYIKSLENEYANIQIAEDKVEDHEKIAKWLFTEIQGIDVEDAEALIEKRKDSGTLLEFVKKGVAIVSQQRQSEIDAETNRVLEENKAAYAQQVAFQQEVENAFKTNNFNGVRLDNKVLGEVQKLTTPSNGEIPLQGIVDKFNGSQHTLLNYFAYCLANNLPIEYKPVNAKPSGQGTPVHQLLGKTGTASKGDVISNLSELKNIVFGTK